MVDKHSNVISEFREFRLPESFPAHWLPLEVQLFIRRIEIQHIQHPICRRALKVLAQEAGFKPSYTNLEELGLVGLRLDCRGQQIPLMVRFESIPRIPERCQHTIDMFEDVKAGHS